MARRVNYNENDLRLLAQLMLAEARGEGSLGEAMVGSVVLNRIYANCAPDFKGLRDIRSAVLQYIPGTSLPHFEPVLNGTLWSQSPRPTDIQAARNLANGGIEPRARDSLWFHNPTPGARYRGPCPATMPVAPSTQFEFAFKNHCFYRGAPGYCATFYR